MCAAHLTAGLERVSVRLRAGTMTMLAAQQGRFAPWLAVAMGGGVLTYFQAEEEPGQGALWLSLPLLVLAVWLGLRRPLLGWAVGLVAASLLGFGISAWHAARMPPPLLLPAQAVTVTGRVLEVEMLPGGRRVTLADARLGQGEPLPRTLRVRLRAEDPLRPAPGQVLRVRALLRQPSSPLVPGGWDFQRAAFFSGLGGSGFALGPADILEGDGRAPPLAPLRLRIETRVAEVLPGPAGAIATALLTGSQGAIPDDAMAAMRDSGLAHLLSVSGLHMTIVMGVSFVVLRFLVALWPALALRVSGKAVAAPGALAAGGFYMLLTGAEVPMQRCFAMAALVTLGILAGRRALSLRLLAVAAAAVMLLDPAQLLGPSFQMSFAAVLALIAGMDAVRPLLARLRGPGLARRILLGLVASTLVSVLAGAATMPVGLHHFGRLQLFGVLANALAVPVTSFAVMPAGMLALGLAPLGLDGPALWLMGAGVEAILAIAQAVAALPGAAPVAVPLPAFVLALLALGACWIALWRGALTLLGLPLMVAALVLGLRARPPDVLVSADARITLIRTESGAFLHRLPGASAFVQEGMLRALGVSEASPLPAEGEDSAGAIRCLLTACTVDLHGATAVLFRPDPPARGARRGAPPDPTALRAACGTAALVVSPEPLRAACRGSAVIDRFSVWRAGAHAVWLTQRGALVQTDRASRGARPWVPPPSQPGRPDPLPPAPRDGEPSAATGS